MQRKWDERGRVDKQKVDDCESDSKFSDMLGKCVNEYDVRQRGFASDTQTIYYADTETIAYTDYADYADLKL